MLDPKLLAIELGKALPPPGEMSLEQSRYWIAVAETLTDDQFLSLIRVTEALASPMSIILRGLVQAKARGEANVQ